ncbi:hypothetical protein Poli38472_008728 [Pythium oligandrum]|uniref:SKP1 component dimerisation domain-containing protein n=1 Tax=Pythium oligandrum TaxID=41045 RepID=A0A8K1C439_PYTOL|nr:hypothetical protein Poli38472_008728 [Pythium oligandrum]|eukprot:TMW56080.1 hypothetical protein Poli38472_008728 [Pythium oligandrum]
MRLPATEESRAEKTPPRRSNAKAKAFTSSSASPPPPPSPPPATLADIMSKMGYGALNPNGRSKLQLQCSDGALFDVTHNEAMMSSTLWMLLQDASDRTGKTSVRQHTIPIFDVPSSSVELALYYCRCLYKYQVEGNISAMHEWEDRFFNLDSKTLCDLAKVASNLDIQPLVDITCRSIAQIMSATEAAHEIRQKFGLDESTSGGSTECSCDLRNGMSGFDFDVFSSLDHDLSTDEYELVEFDQPSVDELVSFINGDSANPNLVGSSGTTSSKSNKNCRVHGADDQNESTNGGPSSANKKKKKKKKKKKTAPSQPSGARQTSDQTGSEDVDGNDDEDDADDDNEGSASALQSELLGSSALLSSKDLIEKMRLAQKNPSAVFQESQFEDEDDEEVEEQIESFRLALESAHLDSKPTKLKPRFKFAPQDVFRSTLAATHRQSATIS